MIGPSTTPVVIDTDNGLGSPRTFRERFLGGDVDDAFALAFLLASRAPITVITNVDGNVKAAASERNVRELLRVMRLEVACQPSGRELSLPGGDCRYLALGPLTNLAALLERGFRPLEITMTLGRIRTRGRFAPYWPMEFNATKDLASFTATLRAPGPKRIVPLDVAARLTLGPERDRDLQASVTGRYLARHSRRWRWRNRLLKGRAYFPVWDLVSACALTLPQTCRIEKGVGYLFERGLFLCDVDDRPRTTHDRRRALYATEIDIVTEIDAPAIWRAFFGVLSSIRADPS